MKLRDLDAKFYRREWRACHVGAPDCRTVSEHDGHDWHLPVDDISSADGVMFLCPKCFQANGGSVGTHSIICWRPRVPDDVAPKPGRWELVGTGIDDLTLVAGSSSILLTGGCCAHFFIRNGSIEDLT